MNKDERCGICRKPDLRRLIELGWNADMNAKDLASALGGLPSSTAIQKHLRDHAESSAARNIPVERSRPVRDRVLELQRTLLEEVERRISFAQDRAAHAKATLNPEADWSDWYDVLAKDNQQAIATIIKMQVMEDKKTIVERTQKIDLFKALTANNTPPPRLIGDGGPDDEDVEGEAHEV